MDISNAFGKALRDQRVKAGLTQEQLWLEAYSQPSGAYSAAANNNNNIQISTST
jgi:hypothetical protein